MPAIQTITCSMCGFMSKPIHQQILNNILLWRNKNSYFKYGSIKNEQNKRRRRGGWGIRGGRGRRGEEEEEEESESESAVVAAAAAAWCQTFYLDLCIFRSPCVGEFNHLVLCVCWFLLLPKDMTIHMVQWLHSYRENWRRQGLQTQHQL